MNRLDDDAKLLGEPDDIGANAALVAATQQALEQPGAIGVEFGDALHVDTQRLHRALRRRRRADDLTLEFVGTIRRPVAGGHELKPLAADPSGEQRFYTHLTPRPVCLWTALGDTRLEKNRITIMLNRALRRVEHPLVKH